MAPNRLAGSPDYHDRIMPDMTYRHDEVFSKELAAHTVAAARAALEPVALRDLTEPTPPKEGPVHAP